MLVDWTEWIRIATRSERERGDGAERRRKRQPVAINSPPCTIDNRDESCWIVGRKS